MSAIDKIHSLSLRILTLCGFGAVICLAVNILSALILFVVDLRKKESSSDCG